MLWNLLLKVAAGILALFLADRFIPGVTLEVVPGESQIFGFQLTQYWQVLALAGVALGLLNYFLKPVLKTIALPLRIVTFGLFTIIINAAIVFIADVVFQELKIEGLIPLLLTSTIVWTLAFFLPKWMPNKKI